MTAQSRRQFLARAAALPLAVQAAPPRKRENLKITDIKVTLMSYELKDRAWVTATQLIWKSDCVLVEVFTDKGVVGIGESSPYGGPEFLKSTIEQSIKPVLMGKNPFDVEHLTTAWAGQRPTYAAWAGVDAALWDIIGKASNTPVYRLLANDGPPAGRLRMYASGGVEYAWHKRPDDLIDEAVRHKEEGYTAFKFRIGTEWKNSGMTIQKYIPWVYKLRKAVGPGMDLMQESNMRLTLAECLELCPVLDELGFLWFEFIKKASTKAI